MRVSTQQVFNSGLAGLQKNYSSILKNQGQISSGSRISTPADDTVASVRLLQLEGESYSLEQHKENMSAAQASLTLEEKTLGSTNNILLRVKEISIQAGNGALNDQDRKALAAELQQHEEQLFSLMNTKDSKGEYLFSGYQGSTQPFVKASDGSYSYQGDEGQRYLQISSSLSIATNDNGKGIFESVTNAGRLDSAFSTLPSSSTLRASAPLVLDEVSFSSFPSTGIQLKFDDPSNPKAYRIYDSTGTTTLSSGVVDDKDTSTDSVLFRGVSIQLDGTPVGGEVLDVTFPSTARGKQGILNTVANLRIALEQPGLSSYAVRDAVALAMTNTDNAIESVDLARGSIGSRLNAIDINLDNNEETDFLNKSIQSELKDLDYAEALTRLSAGMVQLEAAQKTYMQINSLSLFNLI